MDEIVALQKLPELLRKKNTVTVPKSKYQAKWQKLLLSRSAPEAAGTAAICNHCKRHLKRKSMPNHAIANGMWMDTASTIPEYADLSEMEALLLASAGHTWAVRAGRMQPSRQFTWNPLLHRTERVGA